jgi:hypothetical protein
MENVADGRTVETLRGNIVALKEELESSVGYIPYA